MSKKMRFVTLFPTGDNQLLVKDVGQIPYTLGKYYDYNSSFASRELDMQGDYIEDVKDGLNLQVFKRTFNSWKLDGFVYLLKNSKRIDWLNIYHCNKKSYYWIRWYKFLKRNGKAYLKLDMDFKSCELLDKNNSIQKLFKKLTELADVVSIENESVKKRIQRYTEKELMLLPNGCLIDEVEPKNIQKKNVFLTVGRLGTKQKATEVLLEAFAMSASKHTWNLKLVGPIEAGFQEYISEYFSRNPELRPRVEFVGKINNRRDMSKLYQEARAFVLPSRWESFGLVLPESLCNGCYLMISEAVPSADLVTNNGKYGKVLAVDDVEAWSDALDGFTKKEIPDRFVTEAICYGREQFLWKNICGKLYNEMKKEEE